MSDSSSFNGSRCTVCGAMYRPGWLCDCVPKSPPAAQPAPERDGKDYGYGPTKAEGDAFMRSLVGNDQSGAHLAADYATGRKPMPEPRNKTAYAEPKPGPDDLVAWLLSQTHVDIVEKRKQAASRIQSDRERIAKLELSLSRYGPDSYYAEQSLRIERAEADNAKLRRVVEAGKAMLDDLRKSCTDGCCCLVCLAKSRKPFDAAVADLEKP